MCWSRTLVATAFLLTALVAGCGGGGGGSSGGTEGVEQASADSTVTWVQRAAMPLPRVEFGAAAVDGKLYIIGGYSGSVLRRVEAYDATTGTWTRRADLPSARRQHVVAAVDGKIYAIGGVDYVGLSEATYVTATEEYDPATDAWTSKAPMPLPPGGRLPGNRFIGGTAVGGKIYIFVFDTALGPSLTQTLEYDPRADVWTTRAPAPLDSAHFTAACVGGRAYVLADAGYQRPAMLGEYDPSEDRWTIKAPLPSGRSAAALLVSEGKLYAVGGLQGTSAVGTVEVFDPSTGRWAANQPIAPRVAPAACEVNGKLYVLGGALGSGPLALTGLDHVQEGTLPVRSAALSAPTGVSAVPGDRQVTVAWTPVPGATRYDVYGRSDGASYVLRYSGAMNRFVWGGLENGRKYSLFVTAADSARESPDSVHVAATPQASPALWWSSRVPMPTARLEAGAATLNGKIYVAGGFSGSNLSTLEEYDPLLNVWTPRRDMPTARRSPVVLAIGGKVYAIGGVRYTNPNALEHRYETEAYDPVADTWTSWAPMPTGPHTDLPVEGVLGNRYVAGAAAGGRGYIFVYTPWGRATYQYDPGTDGWTAKAPIPLRSGPYAAASLGGKIYVLSYGSMDNGVGGFEPSFAEYDPESNGWVLLPLHPTPTRFAALVAVPSQGKVYAIGGTDVFGKPFREIYEYDPATGRWSQGAGLPTARHSVCAAEVDGKRYVIGGSDSPYRDHPFPLADTDEVR